MDIKRLQYFVAVAEEGSFQRAAEVLHIAQSALSRRVRELEDELNMPIFLRLPRGVQLLPAGEILLRHARTIFQDIADTHAHLARHAAGKSGVIRIGVSALTGQLQFFGKALGSFSQVAGGVEVIVQVLANRADALRSLRGGQIDITLIQGKVDETGLVSRRVRTFDTVVAMPIGHSLCDLQEVEPRHLANQPIISFSRDLDSLAFDTIVAACFNAGIRPCIVQQIAAESVRLALVAAGMGVSIVSSSIRERAHPTGLSFRKIHGIGLDAGLDLTWREDSGGPAVQLLVKHIDQAAALAEWAASDRLDES